MSTLSNINKLKEKAKKKKGKMLGSDDLVLQLPSNPGAVEAETETAATLEAVIPESHEPVSLTNCVLVNPATQETNKHSNPGTQEYVNTGNGVPGNTSQGNRNKSIKSDKEIKKKTFDLSVHISKRLKMGAAILEDKERNIVEKALQKYLDDHDIPENQ